MHNEEPGTINKKPENMGWFKRLKEGITTSTKEKKETPEGLWYKCPSCKKIHTAQDHQANKYVCLECGNHQRLGSKEYFEILFDNNQFTAKVNVSKGLSLNVQGEKSLKCLPVV